MAHHADPVLARVAPADLTIADCRDGWFRVTAWCDARCGGRDLDLGQIARWSDRKVLDLMREGLVICARCERPAVTVSVSSTEMSGSVLSWAVGDDAMPRP